MIKSLFIDSSYVIALSSPKDKYHIKAKELAQRIKKEGIKSITTRAILIEIGNALARRISRSIALTLLDTLEKDLSVEIVPLTEELFFRAKDLYRQRPDKEWGLTDCLSFVVMQQRGVTAALTTDVHFRQAGFRALLLDDIYDY